MEAMKDKHIRKGLLKDLHKYKKTIIKFFLVLMVTLSYFGAEFSYYFQANILLDITHDPIDKVVDPTLTLDWEKLTDDQFGNVRLGKITYDNIPKDLIIKLPKYDPKILSQERTDATSTIHNTYLTAWLGEYTGGSGNAKEGNGSHPGIDIRAPLGTPVFAIANGVVEKAENDSSDGNYVVLRHDISDPNDKTKKVSIHSSYLHLSQYSVIVGEIVKAGQQIAQQQGLDINA